MHQRIYGQLLRQRMPPSGIYLRVESGFAEFGGRRLLAGERSELVLGEPIQVGSTQFQVQILPGSHQDAGLTFLSEGLERKQAVPTSHAQFSGFLSRNAPIAAFTTLVVAILCFSLIAKQNNVSEPGARLKLATTQTELDESIISRNSEGERLRQGFINDDAVVAIVSSEPAFLMTKNGSRYDLGAAVGSGYSISRIEASLVEFQRGDDTQSMSF